MKGNGRTTDPPVYVDLVRPFANPSRHPTRRVRPSPPRFRASCCSGGASGYFGGVFAFGGRGVSTGPRRTAPGAFQSWRFLARRLASSEDSSW